MNTLLEIAAAILGAKSVVVSAHVSPDADAIGSSYALALALGRMNISATVVLDDGVPEKMQRLSPYGQSVITASLQRTMILLIVVDTATRRRVSLDMEKFSDRFQKIVNIDHHCFKRSLGRS